MLHDRRLGQHRRRLHTRVDLARVGVRNVKLLRSPLWDRLDDGETFFHNLSAKRLTKYQKQLLNLGSDFIFAPIINEDSKQEFKADVARFKRLILLREQFKDAEDTKNLFFVANPDFEPTIIPSPQLHKYFADLDGMMEHFLSLDHDYLHSIRAPPPEILKALLELQTDKTITIKDADKGLGLVVMNTDWYNSQVASHLGDKINYKTVMNFELIDTTTVPATSSFQPISAVEDLNIFASIRTILLDHSLFWEQRSTSTPVQTKLSRFILQGENSRNVFANFIFCPRFIKLLFRQGLFAPTKASRLFTPHNTSILGSNHSSHSHLLFSKTANLWYKLLNNGVAPSIKIPTSSLLIWSPSILPFPLMMRLMG